MTTQTPRRPRYMRGWEKRRVAVTTIMHGLITALLIFSAVDGPVGVPFWVRLGVALLGLHLTVRGICTWWWLHRYGTRRDT